MKHLQTLILAASMLLIGCQPSGQGAVAGGVDWLMGCWQTEDGSTQERWHKGSSTHSFGSSVTIQDGHTVFFEQMRLENDPDGLTLFAYPKGEGPSPFFETQKDTHSFTVENAEHDYPQKITYAAAGKTLLATISRSDGSDENVWNYARCKN